MGSVCCCLHPEDVEEYANPNSSVYRNCVCVSCVLRNFLQLYASIFRRREMYSLPSSLQGGTPMTSTSSFDNSLEGMYRSPPRPLPYDADRRYSRLQRDGLMSRRDKGSGHSHEESQPLRDDVDADTELLSSGCKSSLPASVEGSKEHNSKSAMKLPSLKAITGYETLYSSSEDEDVCPTCLEEYTEENPKILTRCSHHFHLGCIYEWMERSDNCPVCGKAMEFNETP